MVEKIRCPFCGSPDVVKETEDYCGSAETRLVIDGVYKATPSLPYYFCHYCNNHFEIMHVRFESNPKPMVGYSYCCAIVECPLCGNKTRLQIKDSGNAQARCDMCGQEFSLLEDELPN